MSAMSLQLGNSFPDGLVTLIKVVPHEHKELPETTWSYTTNQSKFGLYPYPRIKQLSTFPNLD